MRGESPLRNIMRTFDFTCKYHQFQIFNYLILYDILTVFSLRQALFDRREVFASETHDRTTIHEQQFWWLTPVLKSSY